MGHAWQGPAHLDVPPLGIEQQVRLRHQQQRPPLGRGSETCCCRPRDSLRSEPGWAERAQKHQQGHIVPQGQGIEVYGVPADLGESGRPPAGQAAIRVRPAAAGEAASISVQGFRAQDLWAGGLRARKRGGSG